MTAARASFAALIVVLLVSAAAWVRASSRSDRFPYGLGYGEGQILDETIQLASLRNIYPPSWSAPPYRVADYPPLFMTLQAPALKIFGPAYWYGRLLCQLAVVGIAIGIGVVVWNLTGSRAGALTAALLVPATPAFALWSQYARVDLPALACVWAALALVTRREAPRIRTAALLFAAAAFGRQSLALAGPVTAVAVLVCDGRRRDALRLVAWFAGCGIAGAAALECLSHGGFLRNTVSAVAASGIWLPQLEDAAVELATTVPVLIACAVIAASLRATGGRARTAVLASAIGGAATALLIVKVGADVNYVLELMAGCCMAAGVLVSGARARPAIVAVVSLALAAQVVFDLASNPYARVESRLAHAADARRLFEIVRAADGPLLADTALDLFPLAGKPIVFQPFDMAQLAGAGLWNDRPLADAISRHAFAAILIFTPPNGETGLIESRWTPALLQAIASSYATAERVAIEDEGDVVVYRPVGPRDSKPTGRE